MKRLLTLLLGIGVAALPMLNAVSARQAEIVTIVVFRDNDNLTLYVSNDGLVSIEGLTIQATDVQGNQLSRRLDQFPALMGLPFDRIAAPVCFQLESNQHPSSLPLECRQIPTSHLFTERLSPADMIWYDSVANEPRLIFITRDAESFGQCPATAPQCEIPYLPPPPGETPSPEPTQKPAFTVVPVSGRAVVQKSTPFRSGPGPQYEIIATVSGGTYTVTGRNTQGSYYQVDYNGTSAWVTAFAQTVVFKINAVTPTSASSAAPLDSTLTYGQTVSGELTRNQKTNYKFTGLAGELISIVVDGKFDSYLEFYSSDGFLLAEDDNSGGHNNPQLNGFTLPKSGVYRIVLRGYGARDVGTFRLTLLKGKVPAPAANNTNTIKYGQKITDFLQPNQQVTKTFSGTQDDVISIVVEADFDNVVQLQDAGGAMLASDNGSGGPFRSVIELFKLPGAGDYQIVLRGYSPRSSGTYTLSLLQGFSPGEEISIKYGQTLTDQIDTGGRKVFVFDGSAGDRISVAVESGFDAHLTLRDERGGLVTDDDDSGGNLQPALLDFKLPAKGTYFLVIFGNGPNDQGPFSINLTAR